MLSVIKSYQDLQIATNEAQTKDYENMVKITYVFKAYARILIRNKHPEVPKED